MPDLETGRRRCADFQQRWRAFVVRWERADRADPGRARRLVEGALAEGLPAPQTEKQPDRGALLRCAMAVVRESGAFDEAGYVAANRSVTRRVDPLLHFVDEGWRDLRAPSLDFDLWWYWCSYLDPTAEDVNPLLHHLLVGRREGLAPVPGPPPSAHSYALRTGQDPAPRLPVRRLRPRRSGRRLRGRVPARAGPARRRLLPGRRRARQRRARQARGHHPGSLERAARGVRLRLLVAARQGPRRLATARAVRRGRARQRQLLRGPAARRRVRRDGRTGLRLVEPAGDVHGVQRGRRGRGRIDAARRRQARPGRTAPLGRGGLLAPELLLPGAPAAGPGRRGFPVPAGHRLRATHQAARRRQVRDRHQPLPDGLGLRVRHLGSGPAPVPPVVLTAVLRPDPRGVPAGQAELPRREPARRPGLRRLAGLAHRRGARGADRPDQGEHRPRLARRPDPARPPRHRGRADRAQGTSQADRGGPYALPVDGRGGAQAARTGGPFPVAADSHRLDPGARALFETVRARPDDPQGRADPLAALRPRRRERGGAADATPGRPRSSWPGAARCSSTGRRGLRSTCR